MQTVETVPKLKARAVDAHKGDFGKVCIIGGSVGMSGAAALAGRSALRAGAGLVRVAVPKSVLPTVASIEPCFTTIALPEDDCGRISSKAIGNLLDAAGDNDALAFGPGVGTSGELRSVLEALLEQEQLRLVIDADGLNNLAGLRSWPASLKARTILTPHPGEMKRLWSSQFREDPPPQSRHGNSRLGRCSDGSHHRPARPGPDRFRRRRPRRPHPRLSRRHRRRKTRPNKPHSHRHSPGINRRLYEKLVSVCWIA